MKMKLSRKWPPMKGNQFKKIKNNENIEEQLKTVTDIVKDQKQEVKILRKKNEVLRKELEGKK